LGEAKGKRQKAKGKRQKAKYSFFQSAEVQKLWVLGKRQEASAVSLKSNGKREEK